MLESAKELGFLCLMLQDEFAHLIDGVNAIEVALALGVAPGEEAMTSENEAICRWILFNGAFNHERKFESGALPGKPCDIAVEFFVEFFQFALAVGAGSQCDGPVGMQMVDVREGKEGVKRSIDGSGDTIFSKSGERIVADHLIFKFLTAIEVFELFEAVEIKKSEAGIGD